MSCKLLSYYSWSAVFCKVTTGSLKTHSCNPPYLKGGCGLQKLAKKGDEVFYENGGLAKKDGSSKKGEND